MTIERLTRCGLHWALVLAMSACGGSTPPPAAPAEAPPTADGGSATDPAAAAPPPAEPEEDKAPPPEAAQAAAPHASDTTLEKPTRPVRNILEAADTVFFLSYEESDVGKTAEASCAKESSGDPQKNAACMAKARQSMEGLGYRFKKNPKNETTTLTILRRQGNTLTTLHKFRYKYGDETETSVVIKIDGKDEGPNKWEKIPAEFKVEVPNDYMITMQDPKYGRLVYYAKVGIPGD